MGENGSSGTETVASGASSLGDRPRRSAVPSSSSGDLAHRDGLRPPGSGVEHAAQERGERLGRPAARASGSTERIWSRTWSRLAAGNAVWPVASSKRMTPSENTSLAGDAGSPRTCSGAR